MNRTIWLFAIAHLFSSCDPVIGYEYSLNNQSDSILVVKFSCGRIRDSIYKALPQSESMIVKEEVWGSRPHDEGKEFLSLFDSLEIRTIHGHLIKKDILDRDSWTYGNEIRHFLLIKTGTNQYHLKLLNEDI
jgi:hypothetical protein